jgi:hypothetical protein
MPDPFPRGRRGRAALIPAALLLALACPLVATAPAGAAKAAPRSFFGTMAVGPSDNDFQRMGSAGIGSYRVGIGWRGVQPTRKGGYHWGGIDHVFTELAKNGIRPVPFLIGTPTFISRRDDRAVPPVRSKSDRGEWSDFVRAAVERYGPGGTFWVANPTLPSDPARDWIVWNEMNAKNFWYPRPQPREYATLLKISARAMHAANPAVDLVTGGMFGHPKSDHSYTAKRYLEKLYGVRGAAKRIDAVSVHPYAGGLSGVRKQITKARHVMDSNGDRRAKIVVGEFGWSSGGRPGPIVKSRQGQARLIGRAARMFAKHRRGWGLEYALLYVWRDLPQPIACPWCQKAGLLSNDGGAKPALGAYKRAIRSSR